MNNKTRNVTFAMLAAALAAFLLFSPAAQADDLVLSFQPAITAGAGSTGNTFDVLLTNADTASVALGAFAYGITTTDTDISFTGANTATTAPYLFAGDSFVDINGFTLFTNSLPGQTLEASDLSNSGLGVTIDAGATVGLGSIMFDVASGAAPGSFAVTFEAFPATSFADPNANNLDFTSSGGSITITNSTAGPEPATGNLLVYALAMASLALLSRRRQSSVRA